MTVILIFIFREKIEFFSLSEKTKSKFENSITDAKLPNSMFVNGIVVQLKDSSECQTAEQGKIFFMKRCLRTCGNKHLKTELKCIIHCDSFELGQF